MEFEFIDPGSLTDGEMQLRLIATEIESSEEEPLPTYRFRIEKKKAAIGAEPIGFINLRIGYGSNITLYRGHIGYGVDQSHRGNGYAERACRLLLPLARRHEIDPIWITCNPDNIASIRTCEKLGAQLIETIEVPENTEAYRAGARVKCRFKLGTGG
jgi:tagatose 1,6-diphosphate aldolase